MTQREFSSLIEGLRQLSPEQLAAIRRELDAVAPESRHHPLSDAQQADQDLQRLLLEAGILSEIKPPVTDLSPYRNRKPVPIQGEPLSDTIIRERR